MLEVQEIEVLATNENRNLFDAETDRIVQLCQSSHKQYHKAWLNYKRIDNADVVTDVNHELMLLK